MERAADPVFFATPAEMRAWLKKHHRTADTVWVGYYKKGTGRPSVTWQESVDEALCYGWIDGIRKSIDAESYTIRFTPRRPRSVWSDVNVRRVAELESLGRMTKAGRDAFEAREESRSGIYAYEQRGGGLAPEHEASFRENAKAWAFWEAQPAGYRKTAAWWVVSAKRDDTRAKRLAQLVADSAAGLRIAQLRREPAKRPTD